MRYLVLFVGVPALVLVLIFYIGLGLYLSVGIGLIAGYAINRGF